MVQLLNQWKHRLTVVVAFDCTDETEKLDHPAETCLHLSHKHTGQDLAGPHTHTPSLTYTHHRQGY